MMQASIPLRFICFLVTILSLFAYTLQANAGVRIAMADDLESGRHFLVTTTIFNRGFDGFFTKPLDSSFLTSGERKDITVLPVKPFLYDHVSADAVHPGYYYDSTKSDKVPFALRTVVLSALRPPSWRYLLDSGAPISEGVVGITPSIVNSHFYVILHRYLPAFDRASIKEDLCQYLPLLHELATFAHSEQAYENSKTTRFSGKLGSGWGTVLTVDLNPILGLENHQQYLQKSYLNFYRNTEGMWKLK
jgi:hypothetical protein